MDRQIPRSARTRCATLGGDRLCYDKLKQPSVLLLNGRYVVLNSGFTYREYAYLNNARQVPKLPDWAIVDLRTPPDSLWPGRIVAADFFDERWQLKPPRGD